jgi:hypothetical protein
MAVSDADNDGDPISADDDPSSELRRRKERAPRRGGAGDTGALLVTIQL